MYADKQKVRQRVVVSACTSPCVPLLQASENMELTTLWERVWPADAISDTPLSDWLEWLDWDSGMTVHKQLW